MTHRRIKAMALCLLAAISFYPIALPVFRNRLLGYFGAGELAFASLLGVFPFVSLVSSLVGGLWQERFGPLSTLRTSLLGMTPGLLLMALSGANWGLFLAGVAAAVFFTPPLGIAVSVLLTRLFPENRRRALVFNLVVVGLGGATIPAFIELCMARLPFSWALHMPFGVLAAVMGAAGLSCRRLDAPEAPVSAAPAGAARPGFRLPAWAWALALLGATHGAADVLVTGWMPRCLDARGISGMGIFYQPGMVLSGMYFTGICARLCFFALPERWGSRLFMILPGLAGGGALLAGTLAGGYGTLAAGGLLGVLCWSWEYPAFLGAMAADGKLFGRTYALSLGLGHLFSFLAAAATGGLMAWSGGAALDRIPLLPACMFIAVGLGGSVYLAAFRKV